MGSQYLNALVCGEGRTEEDFMVPVIKKTLRWLVPHVPTIDIEYHQRRGKKEIEKLQDAARTGKNYFVVVYHLDADDNSPDKALKERFEPGVNQIHLQDEFNQHITPVVPIKMTEAWMLCDFEAFRQVTGTQKSLKELGFPENAADVEKVKDPKKIINDALLKAHKRPLAVKFSDLCKPLGEEVDLGRLVLVPAYRRFIEDLRIILDQLHFDSVDRL